MGHVLMENRHGLVVDARVTQATGTAEREAAVDMASALSRTHRVTLGADNAYDTHGFVDDLRCAHVTPHVAQNTRNRSSAIDGRTTCHAGYAVSQRIRKRIEEGFGWAKTIGGLRKSRSVGREKLDFQFVLTFAADNLVRMRNPIIPESEASLHHRTQRHNSVVQTVSYRRSQRIGSQVPEA